MSAIIFFFLGTVQFYRMIGIIQTIAALVLRLYDILFTFNSQQLVLSTGKPLGNEHYLSHVNELLYYPRTRAIIV